MGSAFFYHLTREPVERALPKLIASARKTGWRVVVRGDDPDRLDWLDERLWLEPEDGFLPHGVAGGEFDADQPVLLTTGTEAANAAECLMSIDGAPVEPDDLHDHERVCILFDGNDAAAVERARHQWKSLTEAGVEAQYWSQESGRWEKKATAGA